MFKLHRDADLAGGRLFGRVEKLATGEQFAFGNADELLAILMSEARRCIVRPESALSAILASVRFTAGRSKSHPHES